ESSLLNRPVLQVTNADELLGPIPAPKDFVEKLVGGKEAYQTIALPEKAEAWLLAPNDDSSGGDRLVKRDRAGPLPLKPEAAKAFSDALLDFKSYVWNGGNKHCIVNYGARLRFTRGKNVVDVWLCFECDMLSFRHDGDEPITDFDPAHNALVKALQIVFPKDKVVQGLTLNGR